MPDKIKLLPGKLDTLIAHKVINLDADLSVGDRRVAGVIIDHFNRRTGQCDPSVSRIATLCGISRDTVIRAVRRLEKARLIQKTRHGGKFYRNSYQPLWARIRELNAQWNERIHGFQRQPAVAGVQPSRLQTEPSSDCSVHTQTYSTNQIENLAIGLADFIASSGGWWQV